jgi:hypothetical protein
MAFTDHFDRLLSAIIMLLPTTLTAFMSMFTALVLALPSLPQIHLGDEQKLPLWAFDTNPPTLEHNVQSTATSTPIRIDHPFIVPVDSAGRPTGRPSVPSELFIPLEEGS